MRKKNTIGAQLFFGLTAAVAATLATPARSGPPEATPDKGTIIDNAKPHDLPVKNPDMDTRTTTDNPSAKISFGHVESVNQKTRTIRVRDQQGNVSNVKVSDDVIYKNTSGLSGLKTGDALHYSIGSNGQVDRLNLDISEQLAK